MINERANLTSAKYAVRTGRLSRDYTKREYSSLIMLRWDKGEDLRGANFPFKNERVEFMTFDPLPYSTSFFLVVSSFHLTVQRILTQ